MCGRYYIETEHKSEELIQIITEIQRRTDKQSPPHAVKTEGEIFPGDWVPVICRDRKLRVSAFPMEWGYHLPDGKRVINARSETAAQKPLFRESFAERRCALPMSAYFEWTHADAPRSKYKIAPEDGALHYLAGLYRFEGNQAVCTVLTRAAAPGIQAIHDRMPVILSGEALRDFLSGVVLPVGMEKLCAEQIG